MLVPFIKAVHSTAGHNLPIARIVIHGTVSATRKGGARSNAAYFQGKASGGSAHYVIDPGEIIQCATDDTICWHAPPNARSLGVEFCDWVTWQAAQSDAFWRGKTEADFNARWDLPEWDTMLRLGAGLVRDLAAEHNVQLVRISPLMLRTGDHGICGHVDVAQAWHETDHTDPGATFPWATFMGYVTTPTSPTTTPTSPSTEEDMKPWFMRRKDGAVVIVGPTGARSLTKAQWQVWGNLGHKPEKGMEAMDPGPWNAVLDSLGGLVK